MSSLYEYAQSALSFFLDPDRAALRQGLAGAGKLLAIYVAGNYVSARLGLSVEKFVGWTAGKAIGGVRRLFRSSGGTKTEVSDLCYYVLSILDGNTTQKDASDGLRSGSEVLIQFNNGIDREVYSIAVDRVEIWGRFSKAEKKLIQQATKKEVARHDQLRLNAITSTLAKKACHVETDDVEVVLDATNTDFTEGVRCGEVHVNVNGGRIIANVGDSEESMKGQEKKPEKAQPKAAPRMHADLATLSPLLKHLGNAKVNTAK